MPVQFVTNNAQRANLDSEINVTIDPTSPDPNVMMFVAVKVRTALDPLNPVESAEFTPNFGSPIPLIPIGNTVSGTDSMYLFYLASPPQTEGTVHIVLGALSAVVCGAVVMSGVDQTNPVNFFGFTSGNDNNPVGETNPDSPVDGMLCAALIADFPVSASTPSDGSDERWQFNCGNVLFMNAAGTTRPTTGGNFRATWDLDNSDKWMVGEAFFAPAGGGASGFTMMGIG